MLSNMTNVRSSSIKLILFYALLQETTPSLVHNACPAPKPCICQDNMIDCRNKGLSNTVDFGFGNTDNFNTIDYGENNLTTINRAAFIGLPNVTTILLDSCNISVINSYAFAGLEYTLKRINLADNNLVEIPVALCRLKKVEDLNITLNNISPQTLDVPCEPGARMGTVLYELGKNLKIFSFGKIGYFNEWPRALTHLQRLMNFQVTGLNVQPNTDISFHAYRWTLKSLTFKYSYLTQIPTEMADLTQLEELHIENNMYRFDLDYTIQTLNHTLKTLTLKSDRLTTFPSNIRFLQRLQNLSLEGNALKFVSDESVAILSRTNISFLSLKNCELKRVPGSLSNVKTLLQLDLSHNKIVTIEHNDLANASMLQSLTLTSNPLRYISIDAFAGLYSLKYLDLSSTAITSMPEGLGNLHSIAFLDLSNTRMDCTCGMVWVKLWKDQNERSGQHLKIDGDCETINSLIDEYIIRRIPTCPEYLYIISG